MLVKRLFAPIALAVLTLAILWVGDSRSARTVTGVRLATTLPNWVAPAARLRIGGWTMPGVRVKLWIGKRARSVTSGPRGGFRFEVRAPRAAGRYGVAVVADGIPTTVGTLRVRPLVLVVVGDVTFGDGVATAIAANGPRFPWLSVARVLRSADLAVANLEGAVSTRGAPWPGKQYTFRGPPAALRAAGAFGGLDAVSTANNHSLDYGRIAFLDTLRYARRFGIKPFGGGADLGAARRPALIRAGNLRVALLGFSDVRPLGFDAGASTSGTAPAFPHIVASSVRAARRRSDIVVVYFHWGAERSTVPNARQRTLARTAFAAGAKVVVGAHPHVLQPIARSGARLVAWSLGNFVFAAHSPGTQRTGILRLRLGADGVLGWTFKRARISGVQPRLGS